MPWWPCAATTADASQRGAKVRVVNQAHRLVADRGEYVSLEGAPKLGVAILTRHAICQPGLEHLAEREVFRFVSTGIGKSGLHLQPRFDALHLLVVVRIDALLQELASLITLRPDGGHRGF